MQTLTSYLGGRWQSGDGAPSTLFDAVTGAPVATVSDRGLDRGAALSYAREIGGPALRSMTFAERGAMLGTLAQVIHEHRDALIDVSRSNGGTTRGDGKFDIDGAAGTLSWYAALGATLGDRKVLLDGAEESVLRSKRFVGQHVLVPRRGVAIHINAFNFPAWGLAEKAAAAWLAGMPVLCKPGTATAMVTHRIVELWAASGALPDGALSLLVGSAGDLLDHVDAQDCVAFTGGSATAVKIRGHHAVVAKNVRINIEADSLNAAVVGPDVTPGSDTWQMFINLVVRDFAQKCGQKCTAVRRILVPVDTADAAVDALVERLSGLVVGDPATKGVEIGPASSKAQQQSVEAGLAALDEACERVWRGDVPADLPPGGYFVRPSLYRTDAGLEASFVHEHEVFGPCATVVTYDGTVDAAVALVAAGGGGLVASVYSDDVDWGGEVSLGLAAYTGRVHWGSVKVHDQSPGAGTVLPNFLHGGPGKAGGGEELGGERGLHFYMQRCAIQADRGLLKRTLGS